MNAHSVIEVYKNFLDYDDETRLIFVNIYSDAKNLVIKIPVVWVDGPNPPERIREFYIEPFDLTKYTYLLTY